MAGLRVTTCPSMSVSLGEEKELELLLSEATESKTCSPSSLIRAGLRVRRPLTTQGPGCTALKPRAGESCSHYPCCACQSQETWTWAALWLNVLMPPGPSPWAVLKETLPQYTTCACCPSSSHPHLQPHQMSTDYLGVSATNCSPSPTPPLPLSLPSHSQPSPLLI